MQLALATDPDMPVTKVRVVLPIIVSITDRRLCHLQRFLRKVAATRELYMKLATLLDMYAKSRPEGDMRRV